MNILFLIFGFISIFLLFSSMLLRQTAFFSSIERSTLRVLKAEHSVHDKWERYKYMQYERKLQPGSSPAKKRKKGEYLSHRRLSNLPTQAKWNLGPIVFASQVPDFLLDSTVTFLESLYGHAPFWIQARQSDPELGRHLVMSWRGKNSAEEIEDLFPEDPLLQEVFYKMCKGSGPYSLSPKLGYPPLRDFLRLAKDENAVLCLPYASHLALSAFLGQSMTQAAVELEKKKWEEKGGYYSITKEELTALSSIHASHLAIQDIEKFLGESHKKTRLDKLIYTDGSHIYLSFPLP